MTDEDPEARLRSSVRSINQKQHPSSEEEITLAVAVFSTAPTFSKANARKLLREVLTEEQIKQGLLTRLIAVFFSTKPEVQAVVEAYQRGV